MKHMKGKMMSAFAGAGDSKMGKDAVAEMIGTLFMARTYAHMAHLKTGSYAQHKALDDFYTEIVDLVDGLAEAAQGKFGKLDIPYVELIGDVNKPIVGLEMQLEKIQELGAGCGAPWLGTIVQEVEAFYYSTLYLLKELA